MSVPARAKGVRVDPGLTSRQRSARR